MPHPQSGCIQRLPSVWGSVFCRLQIVAAAAALPRSRAQRTALGLRDRLRPRLRPQPMRRLLTFGFAVLLCGGALADEALRLRVEAAGLVRAADAADSVGERRALLERTRGKLLEIRDRHPSQSVSLHLYQGASASPCRRTM